MPWKVCWATSMLSGTIYASFICCCMTMCVTVTVGCQSRPWMAKFIFWEKYFTRRKYQVGFHTTGVRVCLSFWLCVFVVYTREWSGLMPDRLSSRPWKRKACTGRPRTTLWWFLSAGRILFNKSNQKNHDDVASPPQNEITFYSTIHNNVYHTYCA